MTVASNKVELLESLKSEYKNLDALISAISNETALVKGPDHTSVKDIICHRAHWIDLFLGWYRDGQAGKKVDFPAPGYKWNDLKAYNAELRDRQSNVTWPQAQADLPAAHTRLTGLIQKLSNTDLYEAAMLGANNHWTTGRFAESAGPSHYRSASKYLRTRIKASSTRPSN